MVTVFAVMSALVLVLAATPQPTSAPAAGGQVTFSVANLHCANATSTVNLSSVSVTVVYLNSSGSLPNGTNDTSTGSYSWNAGTNYTEDTGLSGTVSILLDASVPPQCPWAENSWLNWTNVGDGSGVDVSIIFAPGTSGAGNGSLTTGNTTLTIAPPAPAFPYFLELAGLGLFCVFLYWTLKGWRRLSALVSGEVS